jgi:hypothetical protein
MDPLVECPTTFGLSGHCIGLIIWLVSSWHGAFGIHSLSYTWFITWMDEHGHG